MKALAQLGFLGVAMTAGSEHFAQYVFRLFAGRQIYIHWTLLAILMCLSAAAGAFMHRLRMKAGIRKRDSESTVNELAMLRAVIDKLPDPIYVKDSGSRFLLANQAAANNMGVGVATGAELLGKTDFDFFPQELAASFFEDEQKVLLSGKPQISKEEQIKEPNGRTRFLLSSKVPMVDAAGQVIGIIGVGRNITALKEMEAELIQARKDLEFKAAHDSLTSLLNRGAILEMLEHELARSVRENGRTAVLLGDLDHFKNINDTHGHPIGDEVLRVVASRLLRTVRPYDLVGRFGGEEFLVVLPGCAAPDALARADQLREAIAASPIPTADGPIHLTISIGVLVAQEEGQLTFTDILREVDIALYAAKDAGRNRCILAGQPLDIRALDRDGCP
jgi:diguanylate cyclase (GGDEF)-like protein/PAS domain S-box-containing protein